MSPLRVYLASASPRRCELLEQMAIVFDTFVPGIDETNREKLPPAEYTRVLAIAKAVKVRRQIEDKHLEDCPVVAADTAVVLDNTIFGKPQGLQQARQMLSALSGRSHRVYSSVAVSFNGIVQTRTSISEVTFRELCEVEIDAYWHSGEPADKAGSYAIQGQGARFVRHLSGSYSGVMGLPLYELMEMLDTMRT